MNSDFWELAIEVLVPLLAMFLGLAGFLFVVIYSADRYSCSAFARATGYETKYEFACYAKYQGRWVPKDFVFGKASELRVKDAE